MDKEVIEKYFRRGIFTKIDLELFVSCNWINEEEKKKIEGEENEKNGKGI